MYESLYEYMFSFKLGKYLRVEWLGHVVGIYLFKKQEHCKTISQSDYTSLEPYK